MSGSVVGPQPERGAPRLRERERVHGIKQSARRSGPQRERLKSYGFGQLTNKPQVHQQNDEQGRENAWERGISLGLPFCSLFWSLPATRASPLLVLGPGPVLHYSWLS
jgi:hypothetical protein